MKSQESRPRTVDDVLAVAHGCACNLPPCSVVNTCNMSLLHEVRHSLRMLARTPGLTFVALLSIAITIGATAVVFTAVKTVLIQPLPYAGVERLFVVRTELAETRGSKQGWTTWNDMQDLNRASQTIESMGIYRYSMFNLAGDGNSPPEALYGLSVTATLFSTLGVQPMLGRSILPEEDTPGRNNEIILSHGLWRRRFNSDPKVIGRSVEINGHACTIIGVMPAGFDFPLRPATPVRLPSGHMDFWAALGYDPPPNARSGIGFGAVVRLRGGVNQAQANQELLAVAKDLQRKFPLTNEGRTFDKTLGFARTGLLLLMAAAGMFLLIGCANVANLVLARALSRHREIAIRMALGAGHARIARQLIAESCVLGVAGGLAGYALTVLAWTLLPLVAPMSIPRLAAARPDWTVFAFTLAVSIANGILFGLAPALRASQRNPGTALRESASRGSIGGARNRLRSALVVGEVAVAVTLVILGGLLTASFVRLAGTDPGFETDRVLASIIIPSGDQYKTPEQRRLLFRRILTGVRALPGVLSAGTVDALPFSGENHGGAVSTGVLAGREIAEINRVSADYLRAMNIPTIEGRGFTEEDMDPSRDTAIVNDAAAKHFWPGQSAVGKRICLFCDGKTQTWKQVVGVVRTIRHSGLDEPLSNEVYFAAGALQAAQFLVVRTSGPAAGVAKSVREAVAAADPKQPVFLSTSMSRLIGDSIADRRFVMTLLAITGCLALLLAAAGVYGVVSYTTSLQTQEIGVRMALGATPGRIHGMVFRHGMRTAGVGIVLGLGIALVLTRALKSALIGLASNDPLLIALAVVVVTLTAAAACLIPAGRATRVDPMAALRRE
jgi:predicted permease